MKKTTVTVTADYNATKHGDIEAWLTKTDEAMDTAAGKRSDSSGYGFDQPGVGQRDAQYTYGDQDEARLAIARLQSAGFEARLLSRVPRLAKPGDFDMVKLPR